MSSADYFRRQSELCVRLALASSDEEWTNKFTLLSLQYLKKAAEAEESTSPKTGDPPAAQQTGERATADQDSRG